MGSHHEKSGQQSRDTLPLIFICLPWVPTLLYTVDTELLGTVVRNCFYIVPDGIRPAGSLCMNARSQVVCSYLGGAHGQKHCAGFYASSAREDILEICKDARPHC